MCVKSSVWPVASSIETSRLTLEPLRVEHAEEMVSVLDDEGLYQFIGGRPTTLQELRETYGRQAVGQSPDGARGWLNWIVRDRATGSVVGTVQATLHYAGGSMSAQVAWIIGARHQGRGYAKEAAAGMFSWLRGQYVRDFTAHIRSDHAASIAVARHLGLRVTDRLMDGELVWVSEREVVKDIATHRWPQSTRSILA